MKSFIVFAFCMFLGFNALAQTPYTTAADPQHPGGLILNGILTKYILINEASFKWYGVNQNGYQPDAKIVTTMAAAKDSFHIVIFGGTWCDDTQFILPRLFKMQELSGFPDSRVTFFGVDRNKKTLGNAGAAFQLQNIPTIIVMKNGKEVGRVVEYGKTGKWDAELSSLLQ